MKKLLLFILVLLATKTFAQKNFIDQPYIEVRIVVDTLVVPDIIDISITISEEDFRGKVSVEELEKKMQAAFESIGINTKKQLSLEDVGGEYKKYLLRRNDVQKTKNYSLEVYDAISVGRVLVELEKLKISDVALGSARYSKEESMIMLLKQMAVLKAKEQAVALAKPLHQKVGAALHISDGIFHMIGKVSGLQIRQQGKDTVYAPIDIEIEKIRLDGQVSVKFKLE